jgi:hypothetical protein
MNMNSNTKQVLLTTALVFLGAFSRLVPHPDNVTAMGAISLLSGAVIRDRRLLFIVPLGAMFISDCLIGFHDLMIPVYLSMFLIAVMGRFMGAMPKALKLVSFSLTGSLIFFLITNLPFWYHGYYSNDLSGLLQSYTAAIPFFRSQVAGDIFFSFTFFTGYSYMKSTVLEKAV